jgi:UPF0042 nucleotide-binding protein
MSGGGKSTARKMLEDQGYFCVDNLPFALIPTFMELAYAGGDKMNQVALCVDVRSGDNMEALEEIFNSVDAKGYPYEILFMECEDSVLVKRYKETRRSHPMAPEERVEIGIAKERETLTFIKEKADYIIDTSNLLTRELKVELDKIFVDNKDFKNLIITVLSFGFKNGIPNDADLVFDVRFLPNPFYYEEMRPLTGQDDLVHNYVMGFEVAQEFLKKLTDMAEFLIPNYINEGKNQLVIAIGCTGGKHRSVTLAMELYEALQKNQDYAVKLQHRDIHEDAKRGHGVT